MNKIFRYIVPVFMMFLVVGSSTAGVINYSEVNETVEFNTVIDEGPLNDSYVNTHNVTHDEVRVVNETINETRHEEHEQVFVANTTNYTAGKIKYLGPEVDRVVFENGTVKTYNDTAKFFPISPQRSSTAYHNATLYLKNGTTVDIVVNGVNSAPKYWLRETVPVYEDHVYNVTDVVNRITTYINHITEVVYEYVEPQEEPVVTEEVNNTSAEINETVNNNAIEDVDNTEEGIPMETTGTGLSVLVFCLIILLVLALAYRDQNQ